MPTLGIETAIAEFLNVSHRATNSTLAARDIIGVVIDFYTTIRVAGTEDNGSSDMLLLEWGRDVAHDIEVPTDLRSVRDADLRFESKESVCLSVARQVFAPSGRDSDFDDEAVQMHVNCFFGPAIGEIPTSHLWIENVEEVVVKLQELSKEPAVAALLANKPRRVTAYVDLAG